MRVTLGSVNTMNSDPFRVRIRNDYFYLLFEMFYFLLIEFISVFLFSIFEILLKICLKPMISLNVGVT
jgi:hypothetical protein